MMYNTGMNNETVYLTSAQIHRLSGLACDALVGIQLSTTAGDQDPVTGCFVHVDDPSGALRFFHIDADGACEVTT